MFGSLNYVFAYGLLNFFVSFAVVSVGGCDPEAVAKFLGIANFAVGAIGIVAIMYTPLPSRFASCSFALAAIGTCIYYPHVPWHAVILATTTAAFVIVRITWNELGNRHPFWDAVCAFVCAIYGGTCPFAMWRESPGEDFMFTIAAPLLFYALSLAFVFVPMTKRKAHPFL